MKRNATDSKPKVTRRRFVQGLIATGAIAGLDPWRWRSLAFAGSEKPAVLSGSHFDLAIERTPVNFTGRNRFATAVNGMVPGPLLRWREGDTVTIAVTNRLDEQTSIHWHGIRTPSDMDGVPGLSFPGIGPGETFTYRFPVRQHGTYWYHAHSDFQEQIGLYAPIVIEPVGKDAIAYDRDYTIMLADWTDEDPMTVYTNLKQQSDYYNYHQRTAQTFFSDARKSGLGATISDRLMWGRMNMAPTDLSDVTGATYTFLMNGHAPVANWTALFSPRERVRLRFINASAMTIFDVRIPGLQMSVVQTDGNDVEPVTVDEFRISLAETYDVIVEPRDDTAYTIFAQAFDRTGYARGTLAPRTGMSAPVPPMDPRPMLTMADMGMGNMAGMEMGGSSASKMGSMPGMQMPGAKPSTSAATPTASANEIDMSGMSEEEMKNMPGMEMPMPTPTATPAPRTYRSATGEPIGQPGPNVIPIGPRPEAANLVPVVSKPHLSVGPEVDNVAEMPMERIDDPGVGLRDNGRKVLTYADLRARYRGTDLRAPTREIQLHLTGNMERFIWGFDGKKLDEAEPIRLRLGERVRIVLINDSMMNHPIHLHGLWSELENGHGEFRPYKHTVNVQPGQRLSFLLNADTRGAWAFHCHLLYHMEAGMFRTVVVS